MFDDIQENLSKLRENIESEDSNEQERLHKHTGRT